MNLTKVKKEDLIFSNYDNNDCTNTHLSLDDYDWMNYRLETRFGTKKLGIINICFEYFGSTISFMNVIQTLGNKSKYYQYEYSSDIFKKHIIKFMAKHISSWESTQAFYGEDEVIDFYNEVLDSGIIKKTS